MKSINKNLIFLYPNSFTLITLIQILLFTNILFSNINYTNCDLPVHCKREEIQGHWTFRVNKQIFDLNLQNIKSTCGHGFPDKVEKLQNDINYTFENFKEIEILLDSDYTIKDPYTKVQKGKWTPIYDEGFIVNFENSIFTAFMKYYLKPSVKKNKPDEKDYLSNCQKTMIGWYQMDSNQPNKNWSCFFGYKNIIAEEFNYPSKDELLDYNKGNNGGYKRVPKYALRPNENFTIFQKVIYNENKNIYETQKINNNNNNIKFNNMNNIDEHKILQESFDNILQKKFEENLEEEEQIEEDEKDDGEEDYLQNDIKESFLEVKSKSNSKIQMENLQYENQLDFVNEINSNEQLLWKADLHNEFKGFSFMELKNKLGMKNKISRKKWTVDNFKKIKISNFDNLKTKGSQKSLKNVTKRLRNKQITLVKPQNSSTKLISNQNKSKISNTNNSNTPSAPLTKSKSRLSDNNKDKKSINDLNVFSFKQISTENNKNNNQHNYNYKLIDPDEEIEEKEEENNSSSMNMREKDGEYVTSFAEISKYFDKDISEIDENTLPKNWDWRNINGEDFITKPRRQGNCGSCYVFSMIASLESRLRILTNNKDQTTFSRQFPISCNFYSEGCDGGYPILVAKFSAEAELIPEKCFEYKQFNAKCDDVCDYGQFPKKYFVSKYEYLGGFYGNTNEIEIMKEIRARGPIPGNMNVPWSFSFYKSGIFSEKNLRKNSDKLSKTTLLDKNLSWSSVEHSILLVGYGEENGVKYWIGMNTWGTDWGEKGFFRILRGENEANIETMGDAARVSFKLRK